MKNYFWSIVHLFFVIISIILMIIKFPDMNWIITNALVISFNLISLILHISELKR